MERIKTLIDDSFNKGPRRIAYMPYLMESSIRVYLSIAEKNCTNYQVNENLKLIIENLLRYIHADSNFQGSINKALGFIGNTGSGKTFIMKMLQFYMTIDAVKWIWEGKVCNFNYKIVTTRQVLADFSGSGFSGIEKYMVPPVICFDDLGAEASNVSYYGNKLNVMEHIIEERYNLKKLSHFTTNLKEERIKEVYGDRVISRLTEQTNFIHIVGNDWRMKKGK